MRAIRFLLALLIGALVLSAVVVTLFVTTLATVTPNTIGILCAGSTLFVTLIGVIKLLLFSL